MTTTLTIDHLRHVLDTRCGGVLRAGAHPPPDDPDGPCEVCVEEFRALALGLPWSDRPEGGTPTELACQALNDGSWSTREVATEACLPLALLSESTAAPGWVERYVERTIREVPPLALRATGLDDAAERCEREGTAGAARAAAWAAAAAGRAARAARAAARAATRAARAARAAEATAGDEVLRLGVQILIECHRGEGQ